MPEATDPAAIIDGLKAALKEERQLLQTLIDHIPDPIFVKNRDCRFLVANLATATLMGVSTGDELLGCCDHDFYPKEMADQYRSAELAVIRGNKASLNLEERILDPSGGEHWMLTSYVPMHDEQGNAIGLIGISRDITIRRKMEATLQHDNSLLKEATSRYQEEILRLTAALQRAGGA